MKASITSNARTEDQEKQLRRMFEDLAKSAAELALKKVNPDRDGLQRLLGQGDEVGSEFNDFVIAQLQKRTVTNQFADEEVASKYGYLSGYKKPKGITDQTNILRQLISGVGYADEKIARQPLPEGAEGWFAIPKWQTIAPTYGEAVQKVLDLIKRTRGKFYNYREGQLGSNYLRQSQKSIKAWEILSEQQKDHDIIVVPAQFGLRHRGRSVRRALEVMNADEFGLGAFAIGIMILTHPERLQHYDDLWIDCAGDEFSSETDGEFDRAPCFGFHDGGVWFGTSGVGPASGRYGSASGFLPQSILVS